MLCRRTPTEWHLVTIIADIGAENVMIHYLNVDPHKHGGKPTVKSVSNVPLKSIIFTPVWIKGDNTDDGTYAEEEPMDRNAYDDCVPPRSLVKELADKLSFDTNGRRDAPSMATLKEYKKCKPTFNMSFCTT